jgi:hypothetical protein
MLDLKRAMGHVHESRTDGSLVYLSASRFDQRMTTRLHLDGGPDESFLMLGYEPCKVRSSIDVADYARCAHELGMTPKAFMARYNPMFHPGLAQLQPYTVRVPNFPSSEFQVLCVNNASAAYTMDRSTWQGVLHAATVDSASGPGPRIVNSTLIAAAPPGGIDLVDAAGQMDFMETSRIGSYG